ncbi:MAG: clostripain-related cysteine peptidase [Bacteroidales bacterium]|nr:clostripain-related cysteine peptidase [Bacteroidales bacterium]
MIKMKRSFFAFTLLAVIILYSCTKVDKPDNGYNRVVVIYFAANNNLSSYAEDNIKGISQGYLPDENSDDILLIYSHTAKNLPVLLRMYKDKSGSVKQDVVSNYTGQNSTTPQVLESLLDKIKVIFPAKEYGLVLWSHGTGWLPEGYYDNSTQYGVSFPDPYADLVKSFGYEDGVEMDVKDLCNSIPYHLSFIVFDCCLMGGIEVAYEFKDKCDFIVASPAEILATGFPYDRVIEPLFDNNADLEEVCKRYYDYYNSQSGVYKSGTIALYNTSKLDALASVCKTIFSSHRDQMATLSAKNIQGYFRLNKHWFYDLADFVSQFATQEELVQFNKAISDVVTEKYSTAIFLDLTISRYSGISTYLQSNGSSYLDDYYKGYQWNIATQMIK